MISRIDPPANILSKLGVNSLDNLRKDEKSLVIESVFEPAKEYSSIHSQKYYSLIMNIVDFYDEKNIRTYSMASCVKELLTNAIYHGPQNAPILLNAYLTLDTKVVACNDGGDYFKDPIVKDRWERKVGITKENRHHLTTKKAGYGLGHQMLFIDYNNIFVDTTQGTIYMIQPVIIPEKT